MQKPYKVLLSAYACEPNKGSEPGVGWNWAKTLHGFGYNVTVITRANNRDSIETYQTENPGYNNIKFIYYDLPNILLKFKKIIGVNIYYMLWQYYLYRYLVKHKLVTGYDVIQHITFGVYRIPSKLYRFDIPFVFGPVGGGEITPTKLSDTLSLKYRLIEEIRILYMRVSYINPVLKKMFSESKLIIAKTVETKNKIYPVYRNKTIINTEIGIEVENEKPLIPNKNNKFRILYVGRLIYLKGFDLSIPAIAKLSAACDNDIHYKIVGSGPYLKHIDKLLVKHEVADKTELVNWVSQEKLKDIYRSADVLLFPSLHDSSGNVVLEALSLGLPVVCLDAGGPATIVDHTCGIVINTLDSGSNEVINRITSALALLKNDSTKLMALREGARKRAQQFSWQKVVGNIYSKIRLEMEAGVTQ